jgi:CheY-like chemotaxis protein
VFRVSRNATGGEIILVAEDDEDQRWLVQNFLEAKGYKVLSAKDGEEAVTVHLEHRHEIALAFLDLGLPRLNGREAFRRMKQFDPHLKAILTSGFIPDSIQSSSAEFYAVVPKPFIPDDLLAIISSFFAFGASVRSC